MWPPVVIADSRWHFVACAGICWHLAVFGGIRFAMMQEHLNKFVVILFEQDTRIKGN
jgi:hypothetical protein